jgi:hypothetical protein
VPVKAVVVIDPNVLQKFLDAPNGPVVRALIEAGEKVKNEAIRLAPKRTQNLSRHIVKRLTKRKGRPAVTVGADVKYALFVHEGTRPHIIRPKGHPFLAFRWAGAPATMRRLPDGRVLARVVHHPGTKPNRFLTNALRVLG